MEHSGEGSEKQNAVIKEYEKIEESLRRIVSMQGREGVLTDYLILSVVQTVDDDGDFLTSTGWHTNPGKGLSYHTMIGLIEYARALMVREAVDSEDG